MLISKDLDFAGFLPFSSPLALPFPYTATVTMPLDGNDSSHALEAYPRMLASADLLSQYVDNATP